LTNECTLSEASLPQTETSKALRREIDSLAAAPSSSLHSGNSRALKLQALQSQLAMVELDRMRVLDDINKGRHAPLLYPLPFAWVETRERLDDRPGVHSGAGYCAFIRAWAKKMTQRRKEFWGPLVSHE
jgi:hypothetical protein